MNIAYIQIHDLSEIDLDDLYERCRDAIDANWPESSTLTSEERKTNMFAIIESGMNNEWPGLNAHSPNDPYIMFKSIDLDTGINMGFISGYLLEDGTLDGRHSFTAPDENGSRNWLYENQTARNDFLLSIGVNKSLFRNIPANGVFHRILRARAAAGAFELLEDVDSPSHGPNYKNILVQYNYAI